MEDFLRRHPDTEYRPAGSCKMGSDSDPMAVVDASIQPRVTTGNTNAPTIMPAEKAAHMMRNA